MSQRMKRDSKKNPLDTLFAPSFQIRLIAFDKDGKKLKSVTAEAHSWLLNFYHIIKMLIGQDEVSCWVKNYSGTQVQLRAFSTSNCWDDVSNAKTEVGVGNSGAAFNASHYKLQGSNVYWGDINGAVDAEGDKVSFIAEIDCTTALTVKEVGLRFPKVKDVFGNYQIVMIERSVLSSSDQLDIPAGGKVQATYEMNYP